MHAKNPPVRVVCKFLHLLDVGDNDYAEELGTDKTELLADKIKSVCVILAVIHIFIFF